MTGNIFQRQELAFYITQASLRLLILFVNRGIVDKLWLELGNLFCQQINVFARRQPDYAKPPGQSTDDIKGLLTYGAG
ncbi:hypothetical protein ES703_46513 [subsurface metagenome]